jgi:hypothetical protein
MAVRRPDKGGGARTVRSPCFCARFQFFSGDCVNRWRGGGGERRCRSLMHKTLFCKYQVCNISQMIKIIMQIGISPARAGAGMTA